MLRIEKNIIAERYKVRFNSLPENIRQQIKEADEENARIRLKRSKRPAFADGDVFLFSPENGVYFYGRILQSKIESVKRNEWMDECMVAFIFKQKTKEKTLTGFYPNYDEVLTGPLVVNWSHWTRGLFETIGNIPLNEEEKNLDYGFFDMEPLGRWGTFKKANGEEIDHEPKYLDIYGVTTYSGVVMAVKTELIINPDLLKF